MKITIKVEHDWRLGDNPQGLEVPPAQTDDLPEPSAVEVHLKAQNSGLAEDLVKTQDALEKAEADAKIVYSHLETAKRELKEANETSDTLSEVISTLEAEKAKAEAEAIELEGQLATLRERSPARISALESQVTDLSNQCIKHRNRIAQLGGEVANLESDKAEAQRACLDARKALTELETEVGKLEYLRDRAPGRIEELEKELQKRQARIEGLKVEVEDLQKKSDEWEESYLREREIKDQTQAARERCGKECEKLKTQLQATQDQSSHRDGQRRHAQAEVERLQGELETASVEIQKWQDEHAKVDLSLLRSESHRKEWGQQLTEANEKVDSLTAQIKQLEAMTDRIEPAEQEVDRLKFHLEERKERLEIADVEIGRMREQLKQEEGKNVELQRQAKRRGDQVIALKEEIDNLEAEALARRNDSANEVALDNAEILVAKLKARVNDRNKSCRENASEIADLQGERVDLKNENGRLKRENAELAAKSLQDDRDRDSSFERLKETAKRAETAEATIVELKENLESANKRVVELEAQKEILEKAFGVEAKEEEE